ncbi:glycosyltransferase [Lacinutrix sp. C3R15]|uniref:glycosyltransferase n=1 Tax=Flavobacteriaceae TaxID=49546 RepID=UPI001C0827A4|nr:MULTISPECIES: glycosyltransferase [Flavobacteriaceae]MBU2939320.1 glycosyltransferase [Lacinutrix sp. C3R15]MDO6622635.1 glycosyltransferase [Oceanihabitans sp. 1_MG-2023]
MIILNIIFYAFIAVVSIQLIYYLFLFSKFAFLSPQKETPKHIGVSVIICAKNEAENLKKFLPYILNQEYPEFEIVLINDNSHDETLSIMEDFAANNNNIKIVNIVPTEAFFGNKKYALTLGIKASKNDYLLFTDADCIPNSKYWIKEITSHFNTSKSIVLGYGAYAKTNKSFLNKLIRFETLLTALQYFSFAKSGIPFMGVGRNLAYKKEEFFKANGFINHIKVRSGDDDLFINQIATNKNTSICFTKDSFTISNPKTTFKDWILQKRRHVSTAKYYKPLHKSLLALFYISQFLFWTLALILLITTFAWQVVLPLFILRILVFYIVFGKTSKKLEERDLLFFLPFLEIFLIAMQLTIFITNLIAKPKYWK